jgi:hypothetical protein
MTKETIRKAIEDLDYNILIDQQSDVWTKISAIEIYFVSRDRYKEIKGLSDNAIMQYWEMEKMRVENEKHRT